jgi:hypothetical protein
MSFFLLSDDSFIFKFGLAILVSIDKKLSDDMDEVASIINNLVQHIDYSIVIRITERMRITQADISKLRSMLT